MSPVAGLRVAALGERLAVQGFGLAGALVLPADDPVAARAAWRALPADVAVVILTRAAAGAVGESALAGAWPLTVVLPEVA
jgi:vacuolar-type H+-ATPase subunit F/Vma7